jgi:hypothetical protein
MPDNGEAAVVQLIYHAYTADRLGTRAIARCSTAAGTAPRLAVPGPGTRSCESCPTGFTWAS